MTLVQLISLLKADLLRLSASNIKSSEPHLRWSRLVSPRFTPVLLLRLSSYFYHKKLLKFLSPIYTWMNLIFFGIEVTPRCEIGAGLFLPHTVGTVIGASKIGENVTIFQGVTLGAKYADMHYIAEKRPVLENNVIIGAGAKVLGGIVIGDSAKVAANSLVLESVSAGITVIGVPAKAIEQ